MQHQGVTSKNTASKLDPTVGCCGLEKLRSPAYLIPVNVSVVVVFKHCVVSSIHIRATFKH